MPSLLFINHRVGYQHRIDFVYYRLRPFRSGFKIRARNAGRFSSYRKATSRRLGAAARTASCSPLSATGPRASASGTSRAQEEKSAGDLERGPSLWSSGSMPPRAALLHDGVLRTLRLPWPGSPHKSRDAYQCNSACA